MNKQASEALAPVMADKKGTDCGSTIYEEFILDKGFVPQIIGRNIVTGGKIVSIGYDNADAYVGKMIKMRTPYGCKSKHICYTCLGDRYHKLTQQSGKIPIGIASTKPFSDLSQKSLKKTHDITVKIEKVEDFNEYFI